MCARLAIGIDSVGKLGRPVGVEAAEDLLDRRVTAGVGLLVPVGTVEDGRGDPRRGLSARPRLARRTVALAAGTDLAPDGHPLHRRLVGRDAIRDGISVYHQQPTYQAAMNLERSASVLHDTADPDVFIAEIDVAFDEADGRRTRMSLVQIFRLRQGQIALLRDYFSEVPAVEEA